jgi:uncharacterized membrane protein YhhN
MPALILWVFSYSKQNKTSLPNLIIIALLFSLIGDVALMFLPFIPKIFILGLAAFLLTHVIYIYLFIQLISKPTVLRKKPYLVFPFVIYGLLLIGFLVLQNNPQFSLMKVPVIIYACVILFMLLTAINLYRQLPTSIYYLLVIGAGLFVVSDSTIALSKFTLLFEHNNAIARTIIMVFYGVAQYLIVKGYLQAINLKEKSNE